MKHNAKDVTKVTEPKAKKPGRKARPKADGVPPRKHKLALIKGIINNTIIKKPLIRQHKERDVIKIPTNPIIKDMLEKSRQWTPGGFVYTNSDGSVTTKRQIMARIK